MATDMRLVVVDFPTAEADAVLLYWNRLTLAGWRIKRKREDTSGGIVIIDFVWLLHDLIALGRKKVRSDKQAQSRMRNHGFDGKGDTSRVGQLRG